ncbi:MAG TPA: response regulator transcription factor [Streptosporangiaceae bacterium]|nr:response regulator transcription factor [Streptosporangiaceae bacterium]
MTDVLVVEDQLTLASALQVAISAQQDLDCAGTAGSVEDALTQLSGHVPKVVLMDVELPGADGIEGTRRIKARYPDVRVLVLTAGATPARLAAAAAAGAAGFLAKDSSLVDILAAIRNPSDSQMVIEGATFREFAALLPVEAPVTSAPAPTGQPTAPSQPAPTSQLAAASPLATRPANPSAAAPPGGGPDWARLTAREREVLALMGDGLDARAIADRLVMSLHTARGHIKNVLMKLGAHSQLEAVVIATRSGLLPARTS